MVNEDFKLSADVLSALNNADEGEVIIKGIDYTRPLNEYPTIQKIVEFLKMNIKPQHVYTDSLNVNGVVVQDAMEKYLADEGLSSSMCKAALKTPLHFDFACSEDKEELEKIKGTPAYFNIGTYLHQALLEPTKFDRAIVEAEYDLVSLDGADKGIKFYEGVIEKKGKGLIINDDEGVLHISEGEPHLVFEVLKERTLSAGYKPESLKYKKAYLKQLIEASDCDPVTSENFIKIQILKKHVEHYGGGIIKRLLHHSKRETSVYYTDPETGIRLKVRPDSLQFEENIGVNAIISVKTTACEDLPSFFNHSAKLNYDLTEGMYQEVVSAATGRDFNTTITIMLQTCEPYAVAVLVWQAEDIEMGKHKFKTALGTACQIIQTGSIKGYDAFAEPEDFGLINMQLPQWNQREFQPINV